jgi:hypothetical protein
LSRWWLRQPPKLQAKSLPNPYAASVTSYVTHLRRFAAGVLTMLSDGKTSIKEKMAKLNRNTRMVFDYLRMTENSTRQTAT